MIYAETARLRLRSLEEGDLVEMVGLLNDWAVVQWMSVIPFPYTDQDAREWLEKTSGREQKGRPEFFAIALKQTDVFLGGIGVHFPACDPVNEGDYEIGYWLGRRHWGNGYMTEATEAAIKWALQQPWIGRLTSRTNPDNHASQNVLKKAGFAFQYLRPLLSGRGKDVETFWIRTAL